MNTPNKSKHGHTEKYVKGHQHKSLFDMSGVPADELNRLVKYFGKILNQFGN